MDRLNVAVPTGDRELPGVLTVPAAARAVVVFAHGSGSGRHSPRNEYVARHLEAVDLGTLLIDLLDEEEAQDRARVFDIPLLADRVVQVTDWLTTQPLAAGLPVGLFGASTGAAAALMAAARRPAAYLAVVSRGGRPDLAAECLERVQVPTLLIVGGDDLPVRRLNREAAARLAGERELVIIPGASHLFVEPGTLERVAQLAAAWFEQHLPVTERSRGAVVR